MTETFNAILTQSEGLDIILLLGIAVFTVTIDKIIQKHHIPQIIGYAVIGMILGPLLGIISQKTINKLEPETASIMLLVVILGAFILQIIGPLGLKFGVRKAGELGLNVTENDLIKSYTVADVIPVVFAGMPLNELIKMVGSADSSCFPVVDNNKLTGGITPEGIRNTFSTQELNDWLVALDIAEPVIAKITPDRKLSEAMEMIRQLDIDFLPIVTGNNGDKHIGMLRLRSIRRRLSTEVLSKQKEPDDMYARTATLSALKFINNYDEIFNYN